MSAKRKRIFGWILLIASSVLWIATILGLVGRSEPAFVLHLSIAAIWLAALDGLWIAKSDEKREDAEPSQNHDD